MKFSFSARHVKIEESIIIRVEQACKTLAEKYDTEFLDACVVMKKENYLFFTDVAIKNCSGDTYQAKDSNSDPLGSFLNALRKIDTQIRKKKKAHRASGKTVPVFEKIDNTSNSSSEKLQPIIIAEILDDLPLMSVNEATRKLTDNQHVFIFENISNNAVNVVYKRDDGNFGWLDYKIKE